MIEIHKPRNKSAGSFRRQQKDWLDFKCVHLTLLFKIEFESEKCLNLNNYISKNSKMRSLLVRWLWRLLCIYYIVYSVSTLHISLSHCLIVVYQQKRNYIQKHSKMHNSVDDDDDDGRRFRCNHHLFLSCCENNVFYFCILFFDLWKKTTCITTILLSCSYCISSHYKNEGYRMYLFLFLFLLFVLCL